MFRKPHVLIIDDDPNMLNLTKMILNREGFEVTTAGYWDQVVEKIKETYRKGDLFDVVILDIMMPERSGFDVFNSLKVFLYPLPPVIILSALTGIDNAVKAHELGAAKYMMKPVKSEKLVAAIKEVIKKK